MTKKAKASVKMCANSRMQQDGAWYKEMAMCNLCKQIIHLRQDGLFPLHYHPATTSYKYRLRR